MATTHLRPLFAALLLLLTTCTQTPSKHSPATAQPSTVTSTYTLFRFTPAEQWSLQTPKSTSTLQGNTLSYNFNTPEPLLLIPADISILGEPTQIRLRFKGNLRNHPLQLQLVTHFMTFERTITPPEGEGPHDILLPAPPAEGWSWHGGENDGKLHGPLRLQSLALLPTTTPTTQDSGKIEFTDIQITARCPADQTSILTATLDDTPSRFTATIRSQTPQPINAQLICTLRDWDKNVLATHAKSLRIMSHAPTEVSVPFSPGTHNFVEAEFTCTAAGQQPLTATAAFVAPCLANGQPGKLNPASPFGMGVYLYRYDDAQQMTRAARMAGDLGIKWSREEFSWSVLEPTRGNFDFTHYDRVVANAKQHGISVYGLLDYWSPWTKPYTPEGIDDYCRYVRAVVQHYKADIHHWEIWNEPNIFFWQGPKDMYVDLLKAAYKTIKEADPTAQVAGCSTSGIDWDFIERVQKLGGPFDILTIHPYRRNLKDRTFLYELQLANKVAQPRSTVTHTIAPHPRPVWITEIGWGTHIQHNALHEGPSVTPRQQAALLARTYLLALAAGIPNISWYDFRNDGHNPLEWEHNFGIVTREFQPKPAYRAYGTLLSLLASRQFKDQLPFEENIIALRFTNPGDTGHVIAAWSIDQPRKVSFPARKGMVLTNLMGDTHQLTAVNGKVEVELLPGLPVFLTANKE